MSSTLLWLATSFFCSRLFKSCSWVFFLIFLQLLSRICPNWLCIWFILVPCSFFVFYCSRKVCPGISIAVLPQRVPGPRPVSPPVKFFCFIGPRCTPPNISWTNHPVEGTGPSWDKPGLCPELKWVSSNSFFFWYNVNVNIKCLHLINEYLQPK